MSVELIGLIVAAFGLLGAFRSLKFAITVLAVASILHAAAALFLGGANITPGHLALAFFLLAIVIRSEGLNATLGSIAYPSPGFFLLLLAFWGVFSGFMMPRLFMYEVWVFPLNTTGLVFFEVPLRPQSSNINQSIYFISDLLIFAAVAGMARTPQLLKYAAFAMVFATTVNAGIAIIDSVTYKLGLSDLLNIIRNSNYAQLYTHEVMGMKRITGSYPEASAFAGMTTAMFAFCLRLWRGGVYAPYTGWIAGLSLVLIVLAFSSTGYLALAVYLAVVYSGAVTGVESGLARALKSQSRRFFIISLGPLALLMIAIVVAIQPSLLDPVVEMFDESVGSKMSSASGVERMNWNRVGFRSFLETYGLGVGLGSIRCSSFVVGVFANLGIVGAVLFGLFFKELFAAKYDQAVFRAHPEVEQIVAAGRSGCFALLLAVALSGSTVDLGLMFYMMAGIACASVARVMSGRRPSSAAQMPSYQPYPQN